MTISVSSDTFMKPLNFSQSLWLIKLTLRLPERQKASTPLRSQSAKKHPGGHKLIEEVLSCKPVFKFFKLDHN